MSSYDAPGTWSMYPPADVSRQGDPVDPVTNPAGPTKSMWPTVIGILSILFGSLGLIMHASQCVMYFMMNRMFSELFREFGARATAAGVYPPEPLPTFVTLSSTVMLISAALLTIWSGFLIFAGIQLLKHRTLGVTLHVLWAIGKLVLSVALLLPMLVLLAQLFSMMDRLSDSSGSMTSRPNPLPGVGFSVVTALISLVVMWSYPLFVLAWLSVRKLK